MRTHDLPIVLFRESLAEEGELLACKRQFRTTRNRTDIPAGSIVIGRYATLPFYAELESDLRVYDSQLINSPREHDFIADAMEWSGPEGVLQGLTPKSYTTWGNLPEGAYVLKGKTNSRKHHWNTHMFAPTRADVPTVARRLLEDSMLAEQGVIVREYVPLKKLDEGINGLPITNEWRTFWIVVAGEAHEVARGFYWTSHSECAEQATWTAEAQALAEEAANRVKDHATFFVLDIAEREDGGWIVVEVNDGQQSGLSMIPPEDFYRSLVGLLDPAANMTDEQEIISALEAEFTRAKVTLSKHGLYKFVGKVVAPYLGSDDMTDQIRVSLALKKLRPETRKRVAYVFTRSPPNG